MDEEPVTFNDVVARFQVANPEGDAEDLAIKVPAGVPNISKEKYDELTVWQRSGYDILERRNRYPRLRCQRFHTKGARSCLRGSASLADAILDTQILLVPLIAPGVKAACRLATIHPHLDIMLRLGLKQEFGTTTDYRGLPSWDSVALQVLTVVEVEKKLYPDYAIVTTGHSLGGSIALLAALTLKGAFPSTEVRTYSYGSPRVGNEAFAEFVNNLFGLSAHRVVHGNDGVPTMIPSRLGYHHHGVEYWQHSKPPSNSTTVQCDMSGEDPRCSVSVPSRGITLAHTNYFGILVSTPFCL
ncbi:hypothetical protein NMY22_g17096 [Coprinellus aureogranulatus]|nr:hypothetical protein NMY22_g17096 [Coprinellus aureogranulatus]